MHQRSEGFPRNKPRDLFGRNLHQVLHFRVASGARLAVEVLRGLPCQR